MKTFRNIIIAVSSVLALVMVVGFLGPSIFGMSAGVQDNGQTTSFVEPTGGVELGYGVSDKTVGILPQNDQMFPQDTNNIPEDVSSPEFVIRDASLSVQVKEIDPKMDEVRKVIKGSGGDITYATSRVKDRETTSANIGDEPNRYPYYPVEGDYAVFSVNVPTENLDELLEGLRGVGQVVSDSVSATNVTLEITGLDAKIVSGTKSLDRLEALLDDAQNVDEVLRVEQALEQRRAELSSWKAQSETLKNRAATSTVTVSLVTEKSVKNITGETGWFEKTWDKISNGLSGSVAIVIVLLSVIIPFGLLYWLVVVLVRRSRKHISSEPVKKDKVVHSDEVAESQPVVKVVDEDSTTV